MAIRPQTKTNEFYPTYAFEQLDMLPSNDNLGSKWGIKVILPLKG